MAHLVYLLQCLLVLTAVAQACIYNERCTKCIDIDVYFHATAYDNGSFVLWNKTESVDSITSMIEANLDVLNEEFNKTPFYFIGRNLDNVTVANNSVWTSDLCSNLRRNELQESWIFSGALSTTVNVYLGHRMEYDTDTQGCGSFPFMSDINYIGITYDVLPPGGNGITLAHEVAHWMGLLHTYENFKNVYSDPCDPRNPGDWVDDTPLQIKFDPKRYTNQTSFDSCPDDKGPDSFWNIMNTVCLRRACFGKRGFFTEGQTQRMYEEWLFLRKFQEHCATDEILLEIDVIAAFHLSMNKSSHDVDAFQLLLFDQDGNEVYNLLKHSISYRLAADMCIKNNISYIAVIYSPYQDWLPELDMILFQFDGDPAQIITRKDFTASGNPQNGWIASTFLLSTTLSRKSSFRQDTVNILPAIIHNSTQGCDCTEAFLEIATDDPSAYHELFYVSGTRSVVGDLVCIPRAVHFGYILISSFSNSNATLLKISVDGEVIRTLRGPFYDVVFGYPRIVSTFLPFEILSLDTPSTIPSSLPSPMLSAKPSLVPSTELSEGSDSNTLLTSAFRSRSSSDGQVSWILLLLAILVLL